MEKTLSTNTKVILIMAVVAAAACLLAVKLAVTNGGQVANKPWEVPHATQVAGKPWEVPHVVTQVAHWEIPH